MATVTDTFTRAAGAIGNAETGQAWANFGGGTIVVNGSNQATTGVSSSNSGAVVDCAAADAVYQCTLLSQDVNPGGLIFRWVDDTNFWVLQNVGSTQLYLRKFVAGVYTDNIIAVTFSASDVFTVTCAGNSIITQLNGVQKHNITDTFNNTGTKGGLLARPSALYDTFSITPSSGDTPPTLPGGNGKYVYAIRRRIKRYRYNASYVY